MELSTKLIHEHNIKDSSGAVMAPIVLSTTFERGDDGKQLSLRFIYSWFDNPNRQSLEQNWRPWKTEHPV